MIKSTNKDAMDVYLCAAMRYVTPKELEEYEAANRNYPSLTLSSRDKRRILKKIRRAGAYHERHEVYRPGWEAFKRIAVVVLVVLSFGFAQVMSIEAVRVTMWESITEWYENSIFFKFINGEKEAVPDEILEYREPKLGDEFTREEVGKNEYKYIVEYESSETLIIYQQSLLGEYEIMLSNEDTEMKEATINGYSGIVTSFISNGVINTVIIWNDNIYSYKISADLEYEELLKIAESIY